MKTRTPLLLVLLAAAACRSERLLGPFIDARAPGADVGRGDAASTSGLPRLAWTTRADGASVARAVAVDAEGNVLVAGSFSKSASFGERTLAAAHAHENVVAKLDREGRFAWTVPFGGNGTAGKPLALAVDQEGNAIVAGSFEGALVLGETVLHASGPADLVIAKLDPAGRVLWATSVERGDPVNESGLALAVGTDNAITLTSAFAERAQLGAIALHPSGNEDLLVARLDRDGAARWAVAGGGTLLDGGSAVSVDASGRATVLGVWTGKARFGRHTLALPLELPSTRCFLARLDPTGEFEQVASLDSLGLGRCTSLAVSADGAVSVAGGNYLASSTISGAFVARFAPGGGWLTLVDPTVPPIQGEGGVANGLVVDPRGAVSVVGHLLGGARFGVTELLAQGTSDAFVASLDPGGRHLWAVALGGEHTDLGHAIAADRERNLVIAGTSAAGLLEPGRLTVWKLGR